MRYFFFVSLILIIWTYVLYPLFLWVVRHLFGSRLAEASLQNTPSVSLIISCYNEEDVIGEKVMNTLALDYPDHLLEIMVMCDGCTDDTAIRAREAGDERVRVIERPHRRGKTAVQNMAAEQASGEILVFSDANAMYDKCAITNLMLQFVDPNIAGVCGEVQFYSATEKKSVGKEEEVYWGYEQFLKRTESYVSSAIGANGAIYAIRKNQYDALPEDIISDLVEPLLQVQKGFRIAYEPAAVAREEIRINYIREFYRKQRIILRSWHGIGYVKTLLNPLKYGIFSLQLWSHKLLRWLMPAGLITLFISNLFLLGAGALFYWLFMVQVFFYLLSLGGWIAHERSNIHSHKLLRLPFYFCLVNTAALSALWLFFKGKNIVTWEPQR